MERSRAELEALGNIISLIDVNLEAGDGDLYSRFGHFTKREQAQIEAAMQRELERLRQRYGRLSARLK